MAAALLRSIPLFKRQPCCMLSLINTHNFHVKSWSYGSAPLRCMYDKATYNTGADNYIMLFKPEEYKLPTVNNSYMQIYDNIPFLDMNLPAVNLPSTRNIDNNMNLPAVNLPKVTLPNSNGNVQPLELLRKDIFRRKGSGRMMRIRLSKMNKHQLKKRRKRDRAAIRKVKMGREKKKVKKRAVIRARLEKKIGNILADNPNSTYVKRPYVIHRLKNW